MANAYSELAFATFTQAILFGLYILTLLHCLRWLLYQDEGWKLRDRTGGLMLVTALILFAFATVNLATSIHASLLLIVGGAENQTYIQKLDIVNTIIENTTYLITDAVLVYRCWVVHGNNWRIICLPIFLWLSCLTSSILIVFYEFEDFPNSSTAPLARRWIYYADVGFYACHIANNIYTTSAIVYRILRIVNDTVGGSRRLYKTGRIVAESGILYAASSLLLFTAYIGASRNIPFFVLAAPVFDAVNYSTSMISFNLVIIRVGQQRAEEEASTLLSLGPSKERSPLQSTQQGFCDDNNASQNPLCYCGFSEQHERIDETMNKVNGTKIEGT